VPYSPGSGGIAAEDTVRTLRPESRGNKVNCALFGARAKINTKGAI